MNNKFTEQLGIWLKTPPPERDYDQGLKMLLQLNGNRILHRNLTVKPNPAALEYHLQKYYNFRVRELTHEQVKILSAQADKITANYNLNAANRPDERHTNTLGRRPDHDSLPDDIKALYIQNADVLRRMREVNLKLRSLTLTDSPCPDSDRFPFVNELIRLDKLYRDNWLKYDQYTPI